MTSYFPSGCEARAINLGNKNMKIGIFTGGTSVRSKNIFTAISRYPTGKHEVKTDPLAELSFVTLTIHLYYGLNDNNLVKPSETCFFFTV